MTEIERIINKGILPEEFLKEEVRCEFFVDEKRKKLWAIGLDLLIEFDRVCKKHNLKYFLIGGSCLGAIRHKGFIPWDDDIDVGMMRTDYEKFINLPQSEFQNPYFLQTPYTDDGYYFSFAKLRNSNTTAISTAFRDEKFNQGMFLDVFPFDNCKLDDVLSRYNKINELIMDNSTYMRKSLKNPTPEDKKRIESHSGRNPMEVWEEIQKIARQYENDDTEYVNLAVCTIYPYDKLLYKKSLFEEIVCHEFENMKFPILKKYDEYLKISFGDYMKFPPIEKRGVWHGSVVFDPDCSYKEKRQF